MGKYVERSAIRGSVWASGKNGKKKANFERKSQEVTICSLPQAMNGTQEAFEGRCSGEMILLGKCGRDTHRKTCVAVTTAKIGSNN